MYTVLYRILSQDLVPNTQIKDLKKELVYTDVFNEDKFYVVSFWATWCIPCINELDAIVDLYPNGKKKILKWLLFQLMILEQKKSSPHDKWKGLGF